MKLFTILALLISQFTVAAPVAATATTDPEPAIREVMAAQQAAWNNGDLETFMAGYWRNDQLRFASGNSYRHGWQATLENYIKGYPDHQTMGKLKFEIIEIEQLSHDAALVFGRWQLKREQDLPQGLFTLVFRKFGDHWLITRDHTSSEK